MMDSTQIGIPPPIPPSTRPPEATPSPLRLRCAEEWLRAGGHVGEVAFCSGLSRHLVRVIAQAVVVNWQFHVERLPYQPPLIDDDDLGRVRELLARPGWTFRAIAKELGVSRDAVQAWAKRVKRQQAAERKRA